MFNIVTGAFNFRVTVVNASSSSTSVGFNKNIFYDGPTTPGLNYDNVGPLTSNIGQISGGSSEFLTINLAGDGIDVKGATAFVEDLKVFNGGN